LIAGAEDRSQDDALPRLVVWVHSFRQHCGGERRLQFGPGGVPGHHDDLALDGRWVEPPAAARPVAMTAGRPNGRGYSRRRAMMLSRT
jgi:hypothetical protein